MHMAFGMGLGGARGPRDTTAPTVSNLAFTDDEAVCDMSEAGTAYYLISASATQLSTSTSAWDTAYSGATVKGSFPVTGGSNSSGAIDTSSLAPGTWYLHVIGQDAAGNRTALSAVDDFVIAAPGPALRGAAKNSAAASQTINVTKPAGTVDGDLLIAKLFLRAGASPVTLAGWTLITSDTVSGGNNAGMWAYKKTASSEGASYTWDAGASANWSVEITSYSGASGVGATVGKTRHVFTATTMPTVSITATANSLIESSCCFDTGTALAGTPSGTTLILNETADGSPYFGHSVVYEGPVNAGATTVRNFTGTNGTSWVTFAIEILA